MTPDPIVITRTLAPHTLPFTLTLRLTHLCVLVGTSAFLGGIGGAAFMWLITRGCH